MQFINQEAKNYYIQLINEFGYIHINTGGEVISIEDLMELRIFLEQSKK